MSRESPPAEQDRSHGVGSPSSDGRRSAVSSPSATHLQRRAPRRLDQDDVTRPLTLSRTQASASSRPAVTIATPGQPATRRGALGDAGRARHRPSTTTSTPSVATAVAHVEVPAPLGLAQLAHLAEHRDGAPPRAPPDPGQRLQRGRHRVGVGVVGVVDHAARPSAPLVQLHPPARDRACSRSAPRRRVRSVQPGAQRQGGGRRGVGDLVGPELAEPDRPPVAGVPQLEGRAGPGRRAPSARQVTSPELPKVSTRADVRVAPSRRRGRRRR